MILGGRSSGGDNSHSVLTRNVCSDMVSAFHNKDCTIRVLGLSYCKLRMPVAELCSSFVHLKLLEELYLAGLNLTGQGVSVALGALLVGTKNTLKVLSLSENPLDNDCIKSIGLGLLANSSLVRLHMNGVPIHDATLEMVINISKGTRLEVLELGNGVDNRQSKDLRFFDVLVDSLTMLRTISTLNISKLITEKKENGYAFGSLVSMCKNLRHVDISACNLSTACLSSIFDKLGESQVTHMNINDNRLGSSALIHTIIRALDMRDTELVSIEMKNVLPTVDAEKLVNYIQKHHPSIYISI
jgi:hypothetical protein